MCNGRIEHIKLKNYKCHRSFESDLKKLTILAGKIVLENHQLYRHY